MNRYKEVEGDLIKLALKGDFDVIAHGCNCFCTMGAGIAPKMAKAFECDKNELEHKSFKGDINKLGQIDFNVKTLTGGTDEFNFFEFDLTIVNCYSQYNYGLNHADGKSKPLDYEALQLCFRKINQKFVGKKIGLPKIGCGLAGGNWAIVRKLIKAELADCDVTVVIFK